MKENGIRAFVHGWTTNAFNPKPALFYLAIFPQFISSDGFSMIIQGMTLGVIHASIAFLWYATIVFSIDFANMWLRKPTVWKIVQSVSGAALIALGTKIAFTRVNSN